MVASGRPDIVLRPDRNRRRACGERLRTAESATAAKCEALLRNLLGKKTRFEVRGAAPVDNCGYP